MRKSLFSISCKVFNRNELQYLERLRDNSSKSFDELSYMQYLEVKDFVNYCFENIPFYTSKLNAIGFNPHDFKSLEVLNSLPILRKEDIKANLEHFVPKNYIGNVYRGSTGGSTGEPLKYSMSKKCYEMGFALMYRGWGYAGYEIGDPILIFGGGSLVGKETMTSRLTKFIRNYRTVSSYGVTDSDLDNVIDIIKSSNPKFLRGYASSISFLAEYILSKGGIGPLGLKPPKAIFTTAEVLSISQRSIIESAFKTKVYNQYGLNDGGISAFENHTLTKGFLIDTERSYMESVDSNGTYILENTGSLLATSFSNRAFPFLRYDTGDLGVISEDFIKIGGNRLVLKELFGRSTDFLEINGRKIGSPVLTVLMGKVDVIRYQVIQKSNGIEFRITKGIDYNEASESFIEKSILEHVGNCHIRFDYSGSFIDSGNKHKFIIKENEVL